MHYSERVARGAEQLDLFSAAELVDAAVPDIAPKRGRKKSGMADDALKTRRESTTLDRVHAAMLLQAGGRANALRSQLKSETERSPDFLRLANALSALYPKESEGEAIAGRDVTGGTAMSEQAKPMLSHVVRGTAARGVGAGAFRGLACSPRFGR